VANIITREQDGTWVASRSIAITCGCGSVVPDVRGALQIAGVGDTPMLSDAGNPAVKAYIRQVGLNHVVPSLNKGKHAVLYNPETGQYIDMLNAKLTEEYYVNIYKVATGQQ